MHMLHQAVQQQACLPGLVMLQFLDSIQCVLATLQPVHAPLRQVAIHSDGKQQRGCIDAEKTFAGFESHLLKVSQRMIHVIQAFIGLGSSMPCFQVRAVYVDCA